MSSIPSWATSGTKVVCIRDDLWRGEPEPGFTVPKSGDVLTIDDVDDTGFRVGLTFREKHPIDVYWIECFKPLVDQADDIATHFAALLDVKEPADV